MSFKIDRILHVKKSPFYQPIDLLILEKTEALIRHEKQNNDIKIFSVNYHKVHSTRPNYDSYKIIEAFNQRDK